MSDTPKLPTYTKRWHNDVYADIDASRPELSVNGKRIVLSGGAGGIGAATAEAFAVAGAAEIIILGRTEKTLQATSDAVGKKHPHTTVLPIVTDITSAESVKRAFDAIQKRGLIDIFINNAAYYAGGEVGTQDAETFWQNFVTNVQGTLLSVQAALKNMSKHDGILINVNSAAAHVLVPGYAGYSTSKIATAKMFDYLAMENPHLKVFNVQPGIIESTGVASKATAETGLSFPEQDTGTYLPLPLLAGWITDFRQWNFLPTLWSG
jgi:NADP-dependent 3-hydroxy acid dehydrogenase YdfG